MRLLAPTLFLMAAPLTAQRQVPALVTEFDRLAAQRYWPGFEPASIPLAIYDGNRTWLVRHPAPPAGFHAVSDLPGASIIQGPYPEVRANTHVLLGGVPTATLLWPDRATDLTRLAATLLHETFHVYQAGSHPNWYGNEATRFTYPVTDSAAQRLQRLETEALRRALLPAAALGCWAARAVALRTARAGIVGAEAMAYERGNDLNEGLAAWVEWRARGAPPDSVVPRDGFGPEEMRLRAYAIGPAQAILLGRLDPGWQARLNADSTLTLDQLLAGAVKPLSCRAEFSDRERDSVAALAGREAAGVSAARAALRREFLGRPGWELVIELPAGTPLWPEQFDPWNLAPLADGEVLHQRSLRLGGPRGHLDILDHWALTTPAGAHPLFDGIRRVLLTGLEQAPTITECGDSLLIQGPGIDGRFTGMTSVAEDQRMTVRPR